MSFIRLVLLVVMGFACLSKSYAQGGGLLIDNSSLSFAIEQAEKRNKVVAIILRDRVSYGEERDKMFPFQFNTTTLEFLNGRFICLAPIGQNAKDIRDRYRLPVSATGVVFVDGKGKLLDTLSGMKFSQETLYNRARAALKASGNVYVTPCNDYAVALDSVAQYHTAMLVRYSPNDSEFKGLFNGNLLNKELVAALNRVDAIFVVEEEGLVSKASPIYDYYKGGEFQHRVVGKVLWSVVADGVKRVEDGCGLVSYKARYNAGDRDEAFLQEFARMLKLADDEMCNQVAMLLLNGYSNEELLSKRICWNIYCDYVTCADERCFPLYVENAAGLKERYGEEQVLAQLDKMWRSKMLDLLTENGAVWSVDEAALKALKKSMNKAKVRNVSTKVLELRIECARRNCDYKAFSVLVNERWEIGGVDLKQLYDWCLWIEQGTTDADVRYRASRWLYVEAEKMYNYDKIHGTALGSMRPYFEHLAVKLYGAE